MIYILKQAHTPTNPDEKDEILMVLLRRRRQNHDDAIRICPSWQVVCLFKYFICEMIAAHTCGPLKNQLLTYGRKHYSLSFFLEVIYRYDEKYKMEFKCILGEK